MNRAVAFSLLALCGFSALAAVGDDRALQQKVDMIFAAYDNADSPGCAVGVVQDGKFVYKRGYGMGSIELQSPLSPESVFYMGSVSKQFTAASVVLAAEQGYLSLDDDIRKWIPEIPFYGHQITLRQMLHHTSGLRDELGLLSLAGDPVEDIHTTQEMIDLIARQKRLNFNPGDEYQYSNSNYFLLAEVVHRATGIRFSRFADENIFEKLGMVHTRFYDDRALVLRGRVPAYSPRQGGGFRVDWSTNFEKVGDGGLMSSVDDLLLWDRNFYNDKLGKGTLLRELQTRGVLNNGRTINYALGLELTDYRGSPVVEHGGALFGYRTELLRFPNQNFSVICLCNLATSDPASKARQIADLYLASKFRKSAQMATKPGGYGSDGAQIGGRGPDVTTLAGLYRDPVNRSFILVAAQDHDLALRNTLADPTSPLEPPAILVLAAPNVFVDPKGSKYVFESSPSGVRMAWTTASGSKHEFDRIQPAQLTAAERNGYSGDYYSDELLATYRVRSINDKLSLTVGRSEPIELRPTLHDEFRANLPGEFREPIVIQFKRNGDKLTGFDLFAGSSDGVRNIGFVKK
ncbi:MAG TPA: serine hydrolase domain-containing protein [Bryobacteraceae bacterium]|nr:serine hydrolase domain-containing protein [Bryobacteraceae bacterium]